MQNAFTAEEQKILDGVEHAAHHETALKKLDISREEIRRRLYAAASAGERDYYGLRAAVFGDLEPSAAERAATTEITSPANPDVL